MPNRPHAQEPGVRWFRGPRFAREWNAVRIDFEKGAEESPKLVRRTERYRRVLGGRVSQPVVAQESNQDGVVRVLVAKGGNELFGQSAVVAVPDHGG